MARILLIGGHGKIALQAAPLLVAAGHEVDAVVRNPDHSADVEAAQANPAVADVETMDTEALTDLSRDHDVVVWSAGAGGGDPSRTYAVDRDAAIRSVDAAGLAGVPRYVMVSYFGAGPDHGVPEGEGFFHYAEAKAAADAHLRASDLDWVVLGPSRLTDDPGTGKVSVGTREKSEVPRADVAAVIAETVGAVEVSRTTYEFNRGDVPIREALRRVAR